MKLVKTASGKQTVMVSRKEWESIGRTAGWSTWLVRTAFRDPYDAITSKMAPIVFEKIKECVNDPDQQQCSFVLNGKDIPEMTPLDLRQVAFNINKEDKENRGSKGGKKDIEGKGLATHEDTPKILRLIGSPASTSEIDIDIFVPTTVSEKDFQTIYFEMVRNLRHELEHVRQDTRNEYRLPEDGEVLPKDVDYQGTNDIGRLKKFDDVLVGVQQHLSQKLESEAYIRELVFLAKKKKIPVKNLISEMVQGVFGNIRSNFLNGASFSGIKGNQKKRIAKEVTNKVKSLSNKVINDYMKQVNKMFPDYK